MESSLVLLKPDCFERNLCGTILCTLLDEDFDLRQIKTVKFTQELCRKHYVEHLEKDFYPNLEKEMVGKNVIAMELLGSVSEIRELCKIIRNIYVDTSYIGPRNLVHSSDSPEAAVREINLWFRSSSLEPVLVEVQRMEEPKRDASWYFWKFVHNGLVHPLLAFPIEFKFIQDFHDWTSRKCNGG